MSISAPLDALLIRFDRLLSELHALKTQVTTLETRLAAMETQIVPLVRIADGCGELETALVKLAANILLFERTGTRLD